MLMMMVYPYCRDFSHSASVYTKHSLCQVNMMFLVVLVAMSH